MPLDTWILFCITELALCFSPGPAVLYVLSQGMGAGFKASVAANIGIVTGNTLYFIVTATGLGALLIASEDLFFVAKWIGTAYLIWLGAQYFLSDALALSVKRAGQKKLSRIFYGALILQLANPKNIVFFMAILPQFINIHAPMGKQILILGITSVIIELGVLLCYGGLGSKIERWARDHQRSKLINYFCGCALILVGISLVLIQKAG